MNWRMGLVIGCGAAVACYQVAAEESRSVRMIAAGTAALTLGVGTALILRSASPGAAGLDGGLRTEAGSVIDLDAFRQMAA